LEEAISEARQNDERRKAVGFDQAALDAAAKAGFGNGAFEDNEEEIPEIVEEFYSESGSVGEGEAAQPTATVQGKPSLKDKLDKKAATTTGDRP